jgi:hypothetical protein
MLIGKLKTALARLAGRPLNEGADDDALAPVNLRARDTSAEALRCDVDYGLQIIHGFHTSSHGAGFDLKGKRVLEIGPGINLAGALGLKALGASKVYVSDRWIAPWRDEYNPAFCRMMAKRIRADNKPYDATVFDRVAATGYAGTLDLVECQAEHLSQHIRDPIDAAYSNAVLEHVADHVETAKSLAAITAPGGFGFHQVDFRCHLDFNLPLEYLLFTEQEYLDQAIARHYELGCQLRPHELHAIFEAAGFQVAWHPNSFVDPEYMQDFLPRLRQSASAYRDMPEHFLHEVGGLYILRK